MQFKRLIISAFLALVLPIIGFLDVEFRLGLRHNTFPGSVLVLLMWPGYACALMLFRDAARNESAGIILFPIASIFNVVIYTGAIYALWSLITRVTNRLRLVARGA